MKHRNRLNSVTALFGALVLAACGMVRSTQVPAPESQKASTDSVVEYLITVAATDFQTHVRSDSIRFRDVRRQDITANLAIVGPRGEKPEPGLFWTLEQYNSVLEIAAEDGKLVGIGYWTLASFSKSKSHRAESRKSLKSLTFEESAKTVKIQVL